MACANNSPNHPKCGMSNLHLWPEPPVIQNDQIEMSFTLEDASGERQRVWYRCSAEHQPALSANCDPYVLAALFIAMQQKADLVVHGQVSPSLLKNLCEYQAAWVCWQPKRYAAVEISAEMEQESERKPARKALTSFSGGLDSAFTAWRHVSGQAGRQTVSLQAGLMLHGFDIRLNQPEIFARAAVKSQRMLESLGLKLVTIASNLKKTGARFEDAHAAQIASCMMLLQGGYDSGLIASSYPYYDILFTWGSNPLTDRMLSSSAFSIIHDGTAFNRLEKTQAIAAWPEAMQDLRVCVHGAERDENCCRCEKCVRTILGFRVLGLGLPACFKRDVGFLQVLSVKKTGSLVSYRALLAEARARHLRQPWVYALQWANFVNRTRMNLKARLKP